MTTPSPTSLPHTSKTSSAGDSGRNAGRGTTAAVVGAVIGLVTVAVLGSLIFVLHDEPGLTVHFAGKIALTLVYASPYLFALIASRARRPATRGGLLLAFGLLSLAASFSSVVSPITLVFLPATFAIWFAAARSLTASVRPLAATFSATILGLAVAATGRAIRPAPGRACPVACPSWERCGRTARGPVRRDRRSSPRTHGPGRGSAS